MLESGHVGGEPSKPTEIQERSRRSAWDRRRGVIRTAEGDTGVRPVGQRDDQVGFSGRPVLDPDDLQLLAEEGMVRMRDGDRFTTVSCEQGSGLRTLPGSKARSHKG